MICKNCGREHRSGDVWKLKDGNYVCSACCEYILAGNPSEKQKRMNFYINLGVLSYDEFKLLLLKPELASQCCEEEVLPISPFRIFKTKFLFERITWLGRISKVIKSAVLEQDTYLVISTASQSAIGIRKVKEHIVAFEQIKSIGVQYSPTKWQLGLACLAIASTIFWDAGLYGLVAMFMLLWMSFGYNIKIKTFTGDIYKIPTKRYNEEVRSLINCINMNRRM